MRARDIGVGVFLIVAAAAPARGAGLGQQRSSPPITAAAEVTTCAQAQMVVDELLVTAMTRLDAARQTNAAADLRFAVDSLQGTIRDARAQLASCASAQATADPPMRHVTPSTPAAAPNTPKPAEPPMDHSKMPMAAPATKPPTGVKPPAAAPMDHSKMPMGSGPATKPAAAASAKPVAATAPMDHATMAMGKPAAATPQAVDPVCGLKVDPASAPQATHEGKTYSFCSEQHRRLFQKTPAKYLPKGK